MENPPVILENDHLRIMNTMVEEWRSSYGSDVKNISKEKFPK